MIPKKAGGWAVLAASFILLVSAGPGSGAVDGKPKVVLQKPVYDFGAVMPGKKIIHDFILQNTGTAELIIGVVGLTEENMTLRGKSSIPPGQEGKISLTLDTSELKGMVDCKAVISTNDDEHPEIDLIMQGRVKSIIDILPYPVVFIATFKGEAKEMVLDIENNDDKPLLIERVEAPSQRFQATLKTIKEGEKYSLAVKSNPEGDLGKTQDLVKLYTNNEKFPELQIPVNLFIRDDVYLFPESVDLGKINLEKLKKNPQSVEFLSQTILVKRRPGKGKDFQISLETAIPFIAIKKTPENGSETYGLDVSLVPEKLKPGKISNYITVRTNDKEVPELKIPVVGEII